MKRMKGLLCVFLAVMMIMPLCCIDVFADENSDVNDEDKGKISSMVVFGDSISAGFRLEGYDRNDNSKPKDCFSNILCEHYGLEYGKSFFNYSTTGDASGQTLEKIKNTDPAIIKNADVIIISVGGNDVIDAIEIALYQALIDETENFNKLGIKTDFSNPVASEGTVLNVLTDPRAKEPLGRVIQKCNESSVQNSFSDTVLKYEANIKEIVAYIRETDSDAEIFLVTPYDPTSMITGNSIVESINKMLTDIKQKSSELAESNEYGYGLNVVDLLTEFKDNTLVWTNALTFDIHPNKDGHQHISEMLIKEINDSLDKKEIANQAKSDKQAPYSDTVVYIIFGIACASVAAIVIHTLVTHKKKS